MTPRALLLGGIGSGKSTAAAWFREQGAVVISADDLARSVLAPGTDATATVLAMWPQVAVEGTAIDRVGLGRIVFADPAELAALESIVHPATRIAIRDELERHPDEIVMLEMALLRDWFDDSWIRIVVDAPDRVRIDRTLRREPAMTEEDVRRIMSRQPTRSEWLMAADYAIDNRGGLADLEAQCELVWERLLAS